MFGCGEDGILQIFSLSGRRVLVELQKVHSIRVRRCCVSGAFPLFFPLLLFQQHGSNPVWDIYATHHHPPLNAPSPAGFLRVWELRRHLAIQSQWVIFTLYGIASRSSSWTCWYTVQYSKRSCLVDFPGLEQWKPPSSLVFQQFLMRCSSLYLNICKCLDCHW